MPVNGIKEVKGQYSAKELEAGVRKFWEDRNIPQKVSQFKKGKGGGTGRKFYLLDGPPYVNARAHVGHIKTRTLKDVWVRFKAMHGFNVWLQPGFDCHGLPVENMVERELGITSKKRIEEMGVEKFIEACRKHAMGNEKEWLKLYRILGDWRGWHEPYLTLENYYIESGWWTVKQMFEKGMLVQGKKSTFWCPHCETALAGYEVTDSYADVKDPCIYVKFPLKEKKNEYIVIFTTTPWTLVSNVAIAVHPDKYYVRAKVGDEILIIAEERAAAVLKDLCDMVYEIEGKFLGKELEGVKYLPVFDTPVQEKLKKDEKAHRIVLSIPVLKSKSYKHALEKERSENEGSGRSGSEKAGKEGKGRADKAEFFDFVTTDEGSGAVHTAPGHGPEDNYIGEHYRLPAVSPVDEEGRFTEDAGEFRGMFVKDTDKKIAEQLERKGLLLHFGWVTHSYPLCWRCKSPLVYRLSEQWFLSVDTIKDKMISANEKLRWLPEFGRERMRNWLDDVVDWCVSRQRYWGIPLPVWVCGKCGKRDVVGSEAELREKSASKLPSTIDLHKHVVDKIEFTCGNCGSKMQRVQDIVDVWFDAGIAPWASLGYPYKKGSKELLAKLWPVDLIDESQDQIRGWFYTLLFCGTAAFNRQPYEAVALNGWVLDEKGAKMSKSMGNVVWADEALEKLGADIVRMYYCWEVPVWETQKFSFRTAEDIRRAMNVLWNSYSFFTTYCTKDFNPGAKPENAEDRWLLSRLNSLIPEIEGSIENFEFHKVGRMLMDFIANDLSRFYIKLIRDRVWVSESGKSKKAALSVLHRTLVTLAGMLAPICPYVSEEIYQNLVRGLDGKAAESIHLSYWPKQDKGLVDRKLEEKMNAAKMLIDACYSARQSAGLKLRWPLNEMVVVTGDRTVTAAAKELNGVLKIMCNVENVRVARKASRSKKFSEAKLKNASVLLSKEFDETEVMMRELEREIQAMRKAHGYNVKDTIALTLKSDEKTNGLLQAKVEELKRKVGAKSVDIGKLAGKHRGRVESKAGTIEISFS